MIYIPNFNLLFEATFFATVIAGKNQRLLILDFNLLFEATFFATEKILKKTFKNLAISIFFLKLLSLLHVQFLLEESYDLPYFNLLFEATFFATLLYYNI